jgi:hypothetical protein
MVRLLKCNLSEAGIGRVKGTHQTDGKPNASGIYRG